MSMTQLAAAGVTATALVAGLGFAYAQATDAGGPQPSDAAMASPTATAPSAADTPVAPSTATTDQLAAAATASRDTEASPAAGSATPSTGKDAMSTESAPKPDRN